MIRSVDLVKEKHIYILVRQAHYCKHYVVFPM